MPNRASLKIDINDIEVSENLNSLSRSSTPSSTQNTDNFGLNILRDQFENLQAANNAELGEKEAKRETKIYKTLLKNSENEKDLLNIENSNLKEQILKLEKSKEESKEESNEESNLEELMDTALGEFSSFDSSISCITKGVNIKDTFCNRYHHDWTSSIETMKYNSLKDFSEANTDFLENIIKDPSTVCFFKLNYLKDHFHDTTFLDSTRILNNKLFCMFKEACKKNMDLDVVSSYDLSNSVFYSFVNDVMINLFKSYSNEFILVLDSCTSLPMLKCLSVTFAYGIFFNFNKICPNYSQETSVKDANAIIFKALLIIKRVYKEKFIILNSKCSTVQIKNLLTTNNNSIIKKDHTIRNKKIAIAICASFIFVGPDIISLAGPVVSSIIPVITNPGLKEQILFQVRQGTTYTLWYLYGKIKGYL